MISVILITSLVIIILILLLSFVSKMTKTPERLKTQSIVIVDTRGQQTISEVEFVKFMDKMGSILVHNRNFDNIDNIADINNLTKKRGTQYRNKFQTKYLDPAAEELKAWIKETDNNPFINSAGFTNPIDDELNDLAGETNPILINKRHKPDIEERLVSLDDLATYIQQIKEINLQFPDNERKSVNLTRTHKLIVELLRQYNSSIDSRIFDKPITAINNIDLPSHKLTPAGEAKMKQNKGENDNSLSQRNSLVESCAFADDDKLGTSNMRSHTNPLDVDEANSAIEGLVTRRASSAVKYTGGRKFILN